MITKQGFEALKERYGVLLDRQKGVAEEIARARADSTEEENQSLMSAIEEQSKLDKQIMDISAKISKLKVIDPSQIENNGTIRFGFIAEVINVDTEEVSRYQICGVDEVDLSGKDIKKISIESPVGRELIGKSVGDEVDIILPQSEYILEVLSVEKP